MKADESPATAGEPPEEEGWTRQFTAAEPRLSEAAALYREAGFEVRLEPVPREPGCGSRTGPEQEEKQCRICFEGVEAQYRVIYTRKAESAPRADKDLF